LDPSSFWGLIKNYQISEKEVHKPKSQQELLRTQGNNPFEYQLTKLVKAVWQPRRMVRIMGSFETQRSSPF